MKKLDRNAFAKHFYERVSKADQNGCRLWNGSPGRPRYGYVWQNGRNRLAHRVAYELVHGPIQDDMCVCHKCDVPRCVNIKHLFLGTQLDNIRDRSDKGRTRCYKRGDVHYMHKNPGLIRRGSRHGGSKLTEDSVLEIKSLLCAGNLAHWQIANLFGVDRSTVTLINRGKSWAHV